MPTQVSHSNGLTFYLVDHDMLLVVGQYGRRQEVLAKFHRFREAWTLPWQEDEQWVELYMEKTHAHTHTCTCMIRYPKIQK